jgi:hypothetical protein
VSTASHEPAQALMPLSGGPESGATVYTVIGCLLAVIDHKVSEEELLSGTLADAGVESWAFTAFLAGVEAEFGFEWDYDVPIEVFQSVQSIAEYVDRVKDDRVKNDPVKNAPGA